jgi:hypothetical protein
MFLSRGAKAGPRVIVSTAYEPLAPSGQSTSAARLYAITLHTGRSIAVITLRLLQTVQEGSGFKQRCGDGHGSGRDSCAKK